MPLDGSAVRRGVMKSLGDSAVRRGMVNRIKESARCHFQPTFSSFLTWSLPVQVQELLYLVRELPDQVLQLLELRKLAGRSQGASGLCPAARGRAVGNAGNGAGTPRPDPETSGIGPGAPADAGRRPGAPGPGLTLIRNRLGSKSFCCCFLPCRACRRGHHCCRCHHCRRCQSG